MARDPAFLFYSDNFQSGTQFFTDEQVGKYIRLLCAQHLHGHLTEKQMLFVCKTYDEEVFAKFRQDDEGKFFNERLEIEVNKRKAFSESRRLSRLGKTKTQDKDKINTRKTYVKRTGNENGNEIRNRKEEVKLKIELPFQTENFEKMWVIWKNYQAKEHRFKYKSEVSEQAALMKLNKLSNHDEQTAIDIITQSLENGWKGLFELKTEGNGQTAKDKFPWRTQLGWVPPTES